MRKFNSEILCCHPEFVTMATNVNSCDSVSPACTKLVSQNLTDNAVCNPGMGFKEVHAKVILSLQYAANVVLNKVHYL